MSAASTSNGYNVLGRSASLRRKKHHIGFLDDRSRIRRMIPSVVGAVIGYHVGGKHPVLGALGGSAVARNGVGLITGEISKDEALRNLGSHAIASASALSLKSHPALGYLAGAVGSGLFLEHQKFDTQLFGADVSPWDAVYTDHDVVLAVQKALDAKGFHLKKGIDGVYGPDTAQAIRSFQATSSVSQTGNIDINLLQALGIPIPKNQVQASPSPPLPHATATRPLWQYLLAGLGIVAVGTGVVLLVKK